MKAVSPLIGTILLVAFSIGVGGIVYTFVTGTTKTSTDIVKNASESLTLCSAALINVPKTAVKCLSGYNLILLTHFDESSGSTASDSSGNGLNGDLANFNFTSSSGWTTNGKFGNGLEFDGIDDYVNLGNPSVLNPSSITISAWWKGVSFRGIGNNALVSKGYTSHTAPFYQYHLGITGDQYVAFSGHIQFDVSVGGARHQSGNFSNPNNTYTVGVWHNFVGTYDGETAKLYKDGVLIATNSEPSGPIDPYPTNAHIAKFTNLASTLPGTIDEIRIYSRALSESEVKQQYESGITELYKDRSTSRFQLQNNGRYNLGRSFAFALITTSASNTTTINLTDNLNVGDTQSVTLSNLTMSPLSVSGVESMHFTSVSCPNAQLALRDLGVDC